jgi:hypothetical protein
MEQILTIGKGSIKYEPYYLSFWVKKKGTATNAAPLCYFSGD